MGNSRINNRNLVQQMKIKLPSLKKKRVEDAVGLHLAHDITVIDTDRKEILFKKGHKIREEDIEPLKKTGKFFVYVSEDLDTIKGYVHEDELTTTIANESIGENLKVSPPGEGKVKVFSTIKGLLKVNVEGLEKLNRIFGVKFATLYTNTVVQENEIVAYVGFGPLFAPRDDFEKALEIIEKEKPIIEVKKFHRLKVGLIVTGTEIYNGLIKDKFTPMFREKLRAFDSDIAMHAILPDDEDLIRDKILEFIEEGCDLVVVSGGLAVDPDDRTTFAIQNTGAEVEFYGAPYFPGSSIMLAYYNGIPIYGTTASPIFYKWTTLDILLPRFFAKDRIRREEIVKLGHGGLHVPLKK